MNTTAAQGGLRSRDSRNQKNEPVLVEFPVQFLVSACPDREVVGKSVIEFPLLSTAGILSGLSVERLTKLPIPLQVVPARHLVGEYPQQEQTLSSGERQKCRVSQVTSRENEVVENF